MIISTEELVNSYNKTYSQPILHISYLLKTGKLFPLKKGLYTNREDESKACIANSLVKGSYISFESALSYYGLILEDTPTIISATKGKRKTLKYTNKFGTFIYKDTSCPDYMRFTNKVKLMNDEIIDIATEEQAILDLLYQAPVCHNLKELEFLLFEDYRIDDYLFSKLNLIFFANAYQYYRCTNIKLLSKFAKKLSEKINNYKDLIIK